MRYMHWMRFRINRLLLIIPAIILFIMMVTINLRYTFKGHYITFWSYFGFSSLSSLLFLITGSVVWLYAKSRFVAFLLLCFSYTMMIAFSMASVPLFNTISVISSITAVLLLFTLLCVFPKNYLFLHKKIPISGNSFRHRWSYYLIRLLQLYLAVLAATNVALILAIGFLFWKQEAPAWLHLITLLYYLMGLGGSLLMIIFSYCRSPYARERQQLSLFVLGVVLAIGPLLLLTVLPSLLNLPAVLGRFSSLTISLFPLLLSYSILRYQILVLDRYIRRAVSYIVGVIFLTLFIYLIVAFCDTFLRNYIFLYNPAIQHDITIITLCIVCIATAVISPYIWWLSKVITDRLFFSEVRHYQRLIHKPTFFVDEIMDVEDASRLIISAAVHTFEIPQTCLFVLEESCGYYRVQPACTDDPADIPRRALIESLLHTLKPSPSYPQADWLQADLPAMQRLALAHRPMLLSELIHSEEEAPTGLGRFLVSASPLGNQDWLLAPVRAQGKMIGALVLGERQDKQPYAGPDFEIVQLLLARFSPVLETARLCASASQHSALLDSLYRVSTIPGSTFKTVDDAARTYAMTVAEAVSARAEIWLYDEQKVAVRRCVIAGYGPDIATQIDVLFLQDGDWNSSFLNSSHDWAVSASPCFSQLSQPPSCPVVWLPLRKNERRLGILVLAYSTPHHFMKSEMHVLEMFADQCAATLENVCITLDLQTAYERQKELDVLKDQFMTTASHELRTPLTAIQGYIELLSEFVGELPPENQREFVEKARLGCDELTLLVSNITDASHVSDISDITLRSIPLRQSVVHVLEILHTTIRYEQRQISVTIDPDIFVLADNIRLRQVLLNLVTNALRYSSAGTSIEITSVQDKQQAELSIRDYGLSIPPQDQSRLFERFVRLERDMNSPVRGAGLGLYICKRLIEAMGGRIWVKSSGIPGEGSLFAFVLQLAPKEKKQESGALRLSV